MKQVTDSITSIVEFNSNKEERILQYTMNKKRANAKLLKGAKR